MKRRKPRSEQQDAPATRNGRETPERFAASRLELDALRAMLGLPSEPTPLSPDETEAPTD